MYIVQIINWLLVLVIIFVYGICPLPIVKKYKRQTNFECMGIRLCVVMKRIYMVCRNKEKWVYTVFLVAQEGVFAAISLETGG